ncbi:sensor histidine kinase inhibitor, KipI family [Paracoccus halophilus]|uniref:Acetyl-COA carboxylase n=1 Tax=Paracoccus halophilus TaxID=376733 RepID=A0A099EVU9_9RHOB|nr:urea amidolyase family protein [Paracoccus halophilus]KGJ02097.1 acetyl-COA carboxylase [Paracoccus halophilus]SFA61426.1 sensor histidine kinase inhibitor, KipI family [Paracoccus halophilus]
MRFLPVGPLTLLVEMDDLDQTMALFEALSAAPIAAIAEIVPAARTLLIRTRPDVPADAGLAGQILECWGNADPGESKDAGEMIEIPVTYDGEDLADVARHMGLSEAELIAAHQETIWRVAFCGFAPGFAYMISDDARFDLPRRSSPRTAIPAGSVALAGRFSGIYPQSTPGGWQLVGTTKLPMWDLSRDPPALLRPGMSCRFVAREAKAYASAKVAQTVPPYGLRVLETAFPILFQDEGRAGQTGQGVSASGAVDLQAMHRANRAVGNPAQAAVLEITLGPVRLMADVPMVLALTGAAQALLDGSHVARGQAFALDAGDEVLIAPPQAGMRSYLALRGGYEVDPVLGSAATDTLAHIGPAPLTAGSVIAPAERPALAVGAPETELALPRSSELIELPVTLGPRTDWFPEAEVDRFLKQEWVVTPRSSRVGIRLEGDVPLSRTDASELPSEGTEIGAIQVPHTGQPILFLADHPLTGGYPVIATLLPGALSLAGQTPPGTRIRFTADHAFAPFMPESPA